MVKTMFLEHKMAICIVFLLLLTIVLYGLAKAVIKMSFSSLPVEKEEQIKEAVKENNKSGQKKDKYEKAMEKLKSLGIKPDRLQKYIAQKQNEF